MQDATDINCPACGKRVASVHASVKSVYDPKPKCGCKPFYWSRQAAARKVVA